MAPKQHGNIKWMEDNVDMMETIQQETIKGTNKVESIK